MQRRLTWPTVRVASSRSRRVVFPAAISRSAAAPLRKAARELYVWVPVATVLVPAAMRWSGASWHATLGAGALLAVLAAVCLVALALCGVPPREPRRERADR